MRHLKRALAAVVCLFAASCSPPALGPIADVVTQSEQIYAQLVRGETDAVIGQLPADYRGAEAEEAIVDMRAMIPEGDGMAAETVGWKNHSSTSGQSAEVALRYKYSNTSLILSAAFSRPKQSAPWTLVGVHLAPAEGELATQTAIGALGAPPPLKPPAPTPEGAKAAD